MQRSDDAHADAAGDEGKSCLPRLPTELTIRYEEGFRETANTVGGGVCSFVGIGNVVMLYGNTQN